MIQEPLVNPIKHRSDKRVVNEIYANFSRDIHALICQTGNLYEVILRPSGNFAEVLKYVQAFAENQDKGTRPSDGFSMIFLGQVGSEKREVVPVNSKYLVLHLERNGIPIPYYLVQLKGSDQIDVYMDFVYMDVLRKRNGLWFIFGLEELAQVIGEKLDNDPRFLTYGFRVEQME